MTRDGRGLIASIGITVLTMAAIVLLSGCAQYTAGSAAALDLGATVNDEALIAAEIVICRAASVGAVERRFMRSQEDWETWNRMCRNDDALDLPVVP